VKHHENIMTVHTLVKRSAIGWNFSPIPTTFTRAVLSNGPGLRASKQLIQTFQAWIYCWRQKRVLHPTIWTVPPD